MGNFIEILESYKGLNADLDDGDNLAKFFGMMIHFNEGKKFNLELKQKIEDHFNYIWSNDKNMAM